MPMQIDIEVWCDGDGCHEVGFAGSYYSISEIHKELRDINWIMKRRGNITQKWWYFCPKCQSNGILKRSQNKG